MKKTRLFYIMKNAVELFDLPETDAYKRLIIKAPGNIFEHYEDPLTVKNEKGIHVIKPLSENESYFTYVCPWCQDIHFGKKDELFQDNGRLCIRCDQLKNMDLKYIIDFHVAVVKEKEGEKGMTGLQFIEKVNGIKEISDVKWNWSGDYFMPDAVSLSVVADDEVIEIYYPRKSENEELKEIQFNCMALLLNKYFKQIGDNYRLGMVFDIPKAIEHIKSLNK